MAGRLRRRLPPDTSITVVEQNGREAAGGRLGEYVWEGHRWETGPSLLLLPEVYAETFAAMGGGEFRETVNVVKVGGGDCGGLESLRRRGTHAACNTYGEHALALLHRTSQFTSPP